MSHRIVKLALDVIEHKGNYSNCIIDAAKGILEWNTSHREKIAKLWKVYHTVYRKLVVGKRGLSYKDALRFSTKVLRSEFGGDTVRSNDFHICKNALGDRVHMDYRFLMLEYAVRASTYQDVALMHRYLVCVNGKIIDTSFTDVAFLRYIDHNVLAEILLFRLSRKGSLK